MESTFTKIITPKLLLLAIAFISAFNIYAQCFVKIESGEQHTIALADDGTLWGWGSNSSGEAGIASSYPNHVLTPTQIGTDTNWTDICAGHYHSLALKSDGSLYTWGYNVNGQLGHGDYTVRTQPTLVNTIYQFAAIGAGVTTSFAITVDGNLLGTGSGGDGELGNGNYSDYSTFTSIASGNDWKQAKGGQGFSVALKTNGTLYATGTNSSGQFGNGNTNDSGAWTVAADGSGLVFDKIDVGFAHVLALTATGNLYCWGNNYSGQLGLGSNIDQDNPQALSTNVVDFSCGEASSIWMTSTAVYTTGKNGYYESQSGTTNDVQSPYQWPQFTAPLLVTKGIFSTTVVTANGTATWGRNDRGICGNGNSTNVTTPTYVLSCPGGGGTSGMADEDIEITVYPNPASNLLSVQLSAVESIEIYSADGKNLINLSGKDNYVIDLSTYENGVYFIRTKNGNVRKFVKQ